MITLSRYTHLYLPVLPTFANGCLFSKRDLMQDACSYLRYWCGESFCVQIWNQHIGILFYVKTILFTCVVTVAAVESKHPSIIFWPLFSEDSSWATYNLSRMLTNVADKTCFILCRYWIQIVGRDSPVGIATRYGLDGPVIESRWGRDFPHPSRTDLGPTQLPTQWEPGLSRG